MVGAATPETLPEMLARLKLGAVRDRLDSLLEAAARRELTLRETLQLLCEAEVARLEERRIQMGMGVAKFPFVRALDGFEFEAQPSLDPKQAKELAACRPAPSLTAPAPRTEPPKAAGSPTVTRSCCSGRRGLAKRTWRWRWVVRQSGSATRCCSCRPPH